VDATPSCTLDRKEIRAMTCIVGLVHEGVVWLGGDSAAVEGSDVSTTADPKVFIEADVAIGYAGSFRVGQLLRHKLDVPDHPERLDDIGWLVGPFVDAVRDTLAVGGALSKSKQGVEEMPDECGLLIGYHGHLYEMGEAFGITEETTGVAAMGAGGAYAIGSLHASEHRDPVDRIGLALEAAERFSGAVRPPFTVVRLEATDG
jgi:ATP-dependent protease HslVU (ClpYQ) peptidase subunit